MADFASWVAACEEGLECKPGAFLEAYIKAGDEAVLEAIYADPLAEMIIRLVKPYEPDWSGTATQLLEKLNTLSGYNYNRPPIGWPQTASSLSNKLSRLAPGLRKLGIYVEFERTSRTRKILLTYKMTAMTARLKNAVMAGITSRWLGERRRKVTMTAMTVIRLLQYVRKKRREREKRV